MNHIDAVAAEFSAIPFVDHDARRLAFAYLEFRTALQTIADERGNGVEIARSALTRVLASQPTTTYSRESSLPTEETK